MKILVVRVSAIGDVIHTIPAILALRHHLPDAHITWIVQQTAASLLRGQPWVDHVVQLPDHFLRMDQYHRTTQIIRLLADQSWDLILDFQGIFKTAVLLAPLRGAKIGFVPYAGRSYLSALLCDYWIHTNASHMIEKNGDLVQQTLTLIHGKPCLVDMRAMRDRVPYVIAVSRYPETNRASVIFCPNTSWPSKHWPLAHWKELMLLFARSAEASGLQGVLVGASLGGMARAIADFVTDRSIPHITIAPHFTIHHLSGLLASAALVVGPDTGVVHYADLLGTPTISFYGPTDPERHGAYFSANHKVLAAPCTHRYRKSHGLIDCMKKITSQAAYESILHIIAVTQELNLHKKYFKLKSEAKCIVQKQLL